MNPIPEYYFRINSISFLANIAETNLYRFGELLFNLISKFNFSCNNIQVSATTKPWNLYHSENESQ